MMDVRVFRDPVYSAAIFTLFAILFSVYGMLLVITQYFQNIRDYSPERAGVVMLAFTVPTIILSPISGGIAARAGGRRPTLIGLCLLLAGLIVIVAGVGGPIVVVLIGLVLVGTAGGLALAPTTNVAMSSIPPDRAGMASGIMSAQRALGSTAGFAIMGSVLAAVVGASLPGKFAPFLEEPARQQAIDVVVDNANPRAVASIIGPGRPLPDAVAARAELIDAADDAFVAGIRAALLVGGGLTVAALIAGTIAFPKGTRDEDDEDAEAATLQVEEEVP
jgi:MFS family permease